MGRRFTAIYRNGMLVPLQPLTLPEETSVELEMPEPGNEPPLITDPDERAKAFKKLFEMMDQNPWPGAAGRFTREELHERR